ncbi:CLUMA_CG012687, isoform A [Clunio marinus]|uniref:CLUMA_CG012687, isoform A n=1 Tax=Clunio marinus TaxID=568069 RepID=A0A1J1IIA7_9DIPT|nr:CLUMA_CG012687, isoform A [Clunio marinus]
MGMLNSLTDFIKNGLPIIFMVLLMCSSSLSDTDFEIQRMVHFEIMGIPIGSAGSSLNMEARSFSSDFNFRSCILARIQDLSVDLFRVIKSKAGGLVILMPQNETQLSLEEKENLFLLEQEMLSEETRVPIYFANYHQNLANIIAEIDNFSSKMKMDFLNQINSNGYQVVVGGTNAVIKNPKISIIQGELPTEDPQTNKPTIIIFSQLKTFGVVPNELPNLDATILMLLIDNLSKLFNQNFSSKYRIIFALHESGSLLNFHATKKFIEANIDEGNVRNIEFVVCLDTLAENPESIFYLHSSKPITNPGTTTKFFEVLQKKAEMYEATFDYVHKKINLADPFHKWNHEIFNIKKNPAFTLSSLNNPLDPLRTSFFSKYAYSSLSSNDHPDSDYDSVMLKKIQVTTKILLEALVHYIFNLDEEAKDKIAKDTLPIDEQSIKKYISLQSIQKSHNIKTAFEMFLKNVKISYDKADNLDPEFKFYDQGDSKLHIYKVKPALFDLFLLLIICCYLFCLYFIIIHFSKVYDLIQSTVTTNHDENKTNGVSHVKSKYI